jgi:hypothetical protein
LKDHPDLKDIFIDVTERPIIRKADYEWQRKDFSWKKKKHSAKNLLVTSDSWEILAVGKAEVGSKHDYTMLKESWYMAVLLGLTIRVDLWFQWVIKDYPYHDVMIPTKKPKWKELTNKQKQENKVQSWIRVIIENIIWRAKKYRIIAQKYRNRTTGNYKTVANNMKNDVMVIVAWLHNLHARKIIT